MLEYQVVQGRGFDTVLGAGEFTTELIHEALLTS